MSIIRILKFPLELNETFPIIEFSCYDKPSGTSVYISFPLPMGIVFSDKGNYSSIDLGVLGAASNTLAAADDKNSSFKGAAIKDIQKAVSGASSMTSAEAASIIAKQLSSSDNSNSAINLATKRIIAPNTNTTFTGNAVRSFSFTFKMVPRSRADTEMIYLIQEAFRYYSYASTVEGSSQLIQGYPPVWSIKFLINGKESSFHPKIYSCYLEGLTSTFGTLSNASMENGAPLDTDVALSFQETRALNRIDITKLQSGERGFDKETLASGIN